MARIPRRHPRQRLDSVNDYAAALASLLELKKRGVALGLDRMRHFAAALGDPQNSIPCIHIAGTNGKGSVAAMLEAILRAAGWRVGLYTSPHLVRLGERIQVDRRMLSESEIARYVGELRPVASRLPEPPTYFEFMTGMAFLHFARSSCDIAVIEVGLGGRLDATNIVTPEVSVITSIGLDHCEILGDTLAAIASEKAGIVKSGRPVVIGRMPAEAEATVRKLAAPQHSQVISVTEEFTVFPQTNLAGDYQQLNAATATLAARQLPSRWKLSDAGIADALRHVDWPARWQRFEVDSRHVILDTSHNAEGAAVLDRNLAQLAAGTGRPPIVIAGVLGLSRAAPLVEVFCRHAREIYFVVPAQSRACSIAQLSSLVASTFAGRVHASSIDALFPSPHHCAAGQPGDSVVVAGSVYLAGEVLGRLEPHRGPAEGKMQDF